MQTTITLSREEQIAIQMLQTNQEALAQVSKDGLTVDLAEVYRWYAKLLRNLEIGHKKRQGQYTTVDSTIEVIFLPQITPSQEASGSETPAETV